MFRPHFRSLVVAGIVATLLLVVASGCALPDRVQRLLDGPPRGVPQELSTVWEAWKVISEDYVDKNALNQSELSEGAIRGMLEALGDPNPDFLTPNQYQLDAPDMGAVWQVWDILVKEHGGTDELDAQLLSEAAVRGMLQALGNRFTMYLSPAVVSLQRDDYSSAFEGIGAHVNIIDEHLTIIAPIPNTPAERAGLLPGDVILAVDGESIEGLSLVDAVLRVRGPKGTSVQLLVLRLDQESPQTITLTRGLIEQLSVVWEPLPEGAAYLRIRSFADETDEELINALREIADCCILSQETQGVILDLRRNLGGLLKTTVEAASQFLDEGLVLYQVDGHGKRTESWVHGGGIALETPLVVLVDGATASGAEVLAGALQDHRRATLIGSRTFGKGSVNILRKLSNGSAVDLTFALWYTPNGKLIEGTGLTPDVVVPMNILIPLGSAFDVQLFMAQQWLKEQMALPTG